MTLQRAVHVIAWLAFAGLLLLVIGQLWIVLPLAAVGAWVVWPQDLREDPFAARRRWLDALAFWALDWMPVYSRENAADPDGWSAPGCGVGFDADGRETEIVMPLPDHWHPDRNEHAERYLADRLGYPCDYRWDLHAAELTVRRRPPLPALVEVRVPAAEPLPPPPGTPLDSRWGVFALGEDADGPAVWDAASAPHMLVCGTSGSGKSTALNSIAEQALTPPWRLVVVDPAQVEFTWALGRLRLSGHAPDLASAAKLLEHVVREQNARLVDMARHGVQKWSDLPAQKRPDPVLTIVDEFAALVTRLRGDTSGNAQRARIETACLEIAERGRKCGMHLLLAAQRVDSTLGDFMGRLKLNLPARLLCGYADDLTLRMLDMDDAPDIEPVKGRARMYLHGTVSQLQVGIVRRPAPPLHLVPPG